MKIWIVPGAALLALSLALNAAALARRAPEPPVRTVVRTPAPVPAIPAFEIEAPRPVPAAPSAAPAAPRPGPVSDLWSRLDRMRAVKSPSPLTEDAVLAATAEALSLGAGFDEAARPILAELRRAVREYEEELERTIAAKEAVPPALVERMEDRRHQAVRALAELAAPSPDHRLFTDRLHEWIAYVLSE